MKGYLEITMADHEANEFWSLGGAGFLTMAETRAEFVRVPSVEPAGDEAPFDLLLDLVRGGGHDWGIVTDKYISVETAETLLGEPLAKLKRKAIAKHKAEMKAWAFRGSPDR